MPAVTDRTRPEFPHAMPPKTDAHTRKHYWIALATPLALALPSLLVLIFAGPDHGLGFERASAWLALGCCLPAAAVAHALLRLIEQKGKAALASRDALLNGFEEVDRLLPSRVMGMALLVILGGGAMLVSISTSLGPRGFLYALVAAAVWVPMGLYTLFRHVYPLLKQQPLLGAGAVVGREITRAQAPLVWALVDEVSARTGVVAPEHIVLGLDASFYATEAPLYLHTAGGLAPEPLTGRSLFLSVPYMAYMTRDELAVVIGHELAHFTGADTEYTLKFARLYARAQQHYAALNLDGRGRLVEATADGDNRPNWMTAPARALIVYFLSHFDLAVQHWSREREFTADAIGAAAVPQPETAAVALLRTTTLASVIEPVLYEFHARGGRTTHPGGLLASVFDAVARAEDLDPLQHLEDSQPHPRESHPPTRLRIEALGLAPTHALAHAASTRTPSGLLEELGLR